MKQSLSRRSFLKTAALGTAAVASSGPRLWSAPAVAGKGRPNLVFVNVDQLSNLALSPFGGTGMETPNLDRLMARGTTFQLSYCADPVCCPSRACWVTGRAPTENGVVYNDAHCSLDPKLPDVGSWLRSEGGYETFHVGKWHVTGRDVEDGFTVLHPGSGDGEHTDMPIARACEGVLRNYPVGGKPFFLMAGLMNPHDQCAFSHVNSSWWREFPYPLLEEQLPPLPASFAFDPREPEFFTTYVRNGQQRAVQAWSEETWRYYVWNYRRQVEMVDGAIGRILNALENSPHADNTLLVFSSDHGDAMASHRLSAKLALYEQEASVPMIVSWPKEAATGRIDRSHLVSGFDVLPTLCDYAGIAPPPDQRGRSMRPVLGDNNPRSWRDYVVSHSYVAGRMVRTARYKYIAYQGSKTDQLFDMLSDPLETRNLSGDSAVASVVADHRQMLNDWESQLKPMPEPAGGWLNQLPGIQLIDKRIADQKAKDNKKPAVGNPQAK